MAILSEEKEGFISLLQGFIQSLQTSLTKHE